AHIYTFTIGAGTQLIDLANGLAAAMSAAPYAVSPQVVTQLVAGFGTPVLYSNLDNHALFDAQTLDFASWGSGHNADFFDNAQPTLTPHLTVKGVGTGELDYYTFTIGQEMINASTTFDAQGRRVVAGTFDIDHGFSYLDRVLWSSQLRLYQTDAQGVQHIISVGQGWSSPGQGGGGSDSWLDDYLTYKFTDAGTYTIAVSNRLSYLNNFSSGVPL